MFTACHEEKDDDWAEVFNEHGWKSSVVYLGEDGKLIYEEDDEKNRLPDFSYAGYHHGEKEIPSNIRVLKYLEPVEGDNTLHINRAIRAIEQLEPDENGFRGALKLAPGIYPVKDSIVIMKDGVVIYGSGSGKDPSENTIILRQGIKTHPVIQLGFGEAKLWLKEVPDSRTQITTEFVQVGAKSFEVSDASKYKTGDAVVIYHPATEAWLKAINYGGTHGDANWEVGGEPIVYIRRIENINDRLITLDAPVFNHLNRSLSQSYMYKVDQEAWIREVGIEDLRITIETSSPTSERHAKSAVVFHLVEDGWANNVVAEHFWFAGFSVERSTRVTVQNSQAIEPHSEITGSRRYNFNVTYSQMILFQNNYANQARHAYAGSGKSFDSGIVFYNNISDGAYTSSEGHRRWGTGFLYDNHKETGVRSPGLRTLGIYNRGSYGTGHGWALAHSAAWGCNMGDASLVVQKPPTAQNYGIGCKGIVTGEGPFADPAGLIEGTNAEVLEIPSLYQAQLYERLKAKE